ncbi:hypothetical protein E4T48_01508 [Aureobasidium sp. EXF-10727]|nr:hypothetical protein E4T48_01508 [Aureobasidium sp. EXF-10727]
MGAWGYDLFQSDTDLDTVDMLNEAADLDKVRQKIVANPARYSFRKAAKPEDASDKETDADHDIDDDDIYMTLYNPSHPDLVQQHLDSGVLMRMINDLRDKGQGNALCILIACAMQLGCNIPDWCREELILVYKKCRLPHEGVVRFGKALHDYHSGIPYPFPSKGLDLTVSTGNPFYKESEIFWMKLEEVPAGEEITQQNTTIKRVYGDFNHPVDVCGSCGAKECADGSKLKRCAGCKERLYCSKTCQKAHTPKHSCLCPGFKKLHEEQPDDACGCCGSKQAKDGGALKRCARCKKRNYCSIECQKEHYYAHVAKCKAAAKEAKEESEGNGGRVKGLNVLQTW